MTDQRPRPDPAWAALVHDVLGRLPTDPDTGKPTTGSLSDRQLRQLVMRAERAAKH